MRFLCGDFEKLGSGKNIPRLNFQMQHNQHTQATARPMSLFQIAAVGVRRFGHHVAGVRGVRVRTERVLEAGDGRPLGPPGSLLTASNSVQTADDEACSVDR